MDQPDVPPCRLRLFERFALVDASGRDLVVGAARHQAIISYVALLPSMACSRDQLATLFWGDTGEANARHSLRQALSELRKRLTQPVGELLQVGRDTVRFPRNAIDVDVLRFERLLATGDPEQAGEAFALFGAGFLPGFQGGTPAFDEWADGQRERTWRLFRIGIEQFADHPVLPPDQAVAAVSRLAAHDPFDEAVHRLVLRTLAQRIGRPAALARHEKFCKLLERELGEAPEAETLELITDIRAIPRMGTPTPLTRVTRAAREAALPRLFENLPPRDLNFTGRDATLRRLHSHLAGQQTGTSPRAAVHGLGGVGKTTLVTEYAYRHAEDYAGVWWARASPRPLLVESLAQLAAALDPTLGHELDQAKAAAAGLALLRRYGRPFLLILDGAESPDDIGEFRPAGNVAVIVTSRWPDWAGRAVEIKLGVLEEDAAADFLQRRAGRTDIEGAERLAEALGWLPLALDHAGAYCRLSGVSFDRYLGRIEAAIAHAPRGVAYPASIEATFGLAIESASEHHPAAEELIGSMAFLAPDRIPPDLAGPGLDERTKEQALGALHAVSLTDYEQGDDGQAVVTLHPLVQVAVRSRLAAQRRTDLVARQTAALLSAKFPALALTDPGCWSSCARLLPHALALRTLSADLLNGNESLGTLLARLGSYLHICGAYGEAEQIIRESISIAICVEGPMGPEVAARQNLLGLLLSTVGRYSEAEPLFREILAWADRFGERRTPTGAIRLNNLARLLSDTKRYAEAEVLFREAIGIIDGLADADASYAFAWRNNLAIVLNETGRNAEAEQVYREAVSIGRSAVGTHHHEMARCLNNLGLLQRELGQLEQSELQIREGLAISLAVLGENHPIHARGVENLAKTLLLMGRLAEALAEAERALLCHETKLGPAHFWTLASATTVARALLAAGKTEQAAEICHRFELTELPDRY